jgi:putative ribosome biogenesis GTPase RsgA
MGRDKDLYDLVQVIATSDKKIVILIGMAGIGKSSLVRNAINYLSERK